MFELSEWSSDTCKMTPENVGGLLAFISGRSNVVVLHKDGPVPLNFIGAPYDPLAEANWLNIPPSTLKKLNKSERASFNRAGPSKKEPTLLGKECDIDDDILIGYHEVYGEKITNTLPKIDSEL